MRIICVVVGTLIGFALFDEEGAIAGGLLGYLFGEIFLLKKKVKSLEEAVKQDESDEHTDAVIFAPVDENEITLEDENDNANLSPAWQDPERHEKIPQSPLVKEKSKISHEEKTAVDSIFTSIGSFAESGVTLIKQFLTGGNLVLKVGIIILFLGVSFLIKYATQQNLLPIEYRLVGAALGGFALLFLGWRLRLKNKGYGLSLQGGGVGILYLVVFGGAKLYELIPIPFSFALMVALVILSGILAVLQDSRALAVFGIIGGFLAPVLMSTGQGSHVMLFSYYALLNVGILGIALYKSWRELNLLGFVFTFGVGTLWGSQGYHAEHFSTTEPFLILFFLFYVTISILFAHRQPIQLRGYIDGPLVFGLPLIVTGLQYTLVKDIQYGMAISTFSLGFFYLLLATLLWRKMAEGMKMLCEAFLAMGVMFASMTIPLALDSNWTTATWALEGAAMVWVGIRQQRKLARLFGILLQIGAAWTFIDGSFYPLGIVTFLNRYFFGCACLGFSALFSSYYIHRNRERIVQWERYLSLPLLIWGMLWWYYGGIQEIDRHFHHIRFQNGVLLFSSATTILMAIVARKLSWRPLAIGQSVLLPIMSLMIIVGLLFSSYSTHLLDGWGLLAWSIAFYSQYRLLHLFDETWPGMLAGLYHVATLWLVVVFCCLEAGWLIRVQFDLSILWAMVGWGFIPSATLFMLIRFGRYLTWPFVRWESYYYGIGVTILVLFLSIWSFFTILISGDPAPLVFIPLINPLELTQIFIIIGIVQLILESKADRYYPPARVPLSFFYWLAAALGFYLANGTVARLVHFYMGVPYDFELLFESVVFQTAISALWSFSALSITIWATRASSRLVWCCGAVLLALVVLKLFIVDLSGTGTIARIISFIVVGILMLIIGYFSPIPPTRKEESL